MTQEQILQVESSQRQWDQTLEHSERMNQIVENSEYNLFAKIRPTIKQDGNKWCVLYGDNLQDGIAGFGDSPYLAILDWNKKWYTKLSEKTA